MLGLQRELARHITVRSFRIKDASDIMRYFNKGLKEKRYEFVLPFRSSKITRKEIEEKWIPSHRRGDTITVVAELDKEVVGAGTLSRPTSRVETGWDYRVTVSPDHLGQGIGTLITQHIVRLARRKGIKKVVGRVIPGNVATMRLNKAVGFRVEGRLRKHFYYKGRYYDLIVWALFP